MRIHPLLVLLLVVVPASGAEPAKRQIFDGKSLDGWMGMGGPPVNWKIEEGVLSCTGEAGASWLAYREEVADFDLSLEFRLPPNGNSGVFIRAPREGVPYVDGMEIQLLDDGGEKWKGLQADQFTGAIYAVAAPTRRVTKPPHQWQQMRIRCVGSSCRVWVNGILVVEADLEEMATTHGKKVPGLKRERGLIGLQNHGEPTSFRNIRLEVATDPD